MSRDFKKFDGAPWFRGSGAVIRPSFHDKLMSITKRTMMNFSIDYANRIRHYPITAFHLTVVQWRTLSTLAAETQRKPLEPLRASHTHTRGARPHPQHEPQRQLLG